MNSADNLNEQILPQANFHMKAILAPTFVRSCETLNGGSNSAVLRLLATEIVETINACAVLSH